MIYKAFNYKLIKIINIIKKITNIKFSFIIKIFIDYDQIINLYNFIEILLLKFIMFLFINL